MYCKDKLNTFFERLRKKLIYSVRLIAIVSVFLASTSLSLSYAAPSIWQDLIPRPKELSVTGEQWAVADGQKPLATIVIIPQQAKCFIGAEEINHRLGELGGPPLPILESDDPKVLTKLDLPIIISECDGSKLTRAIIAENGVVISRKDPGEQGYVIRFLRFRGRPLILLLGSDQQGALYAAITMRWLIERAGNRSLVTVARVRDWPDFKLRGISSLHQMISSLPAAALKGVTRYDALKNQIDWMLRAKINLLSDYVYGIDDVEQLEHAVDWMQSINAYARDRGIIGEAFQMINVGNDKRNAGDQRFSGMMHKGGRFFTWSDDELIRKRAHEIGEIVNRSNLGIVVLHCPDGGGPINPAMWNNRSVADRKRWGNDRASADAHIFTLFHQEIKRINPTIRIVFVIYPYSARYLNFDMLRARYKGLTRDQFEWAGREYFRTIGPKLPKDATICVWISEPEYMDEFRSYFGDRPMYYYHSWSHGWVDAGWLVSTFRYTGTNFRNNPRDIMAARIDRNFPNYINRLLAVQFAWDTRSEGAEIFSGIYYDFQADNNGPDVIHQEWGQRACRHMWGKTLGPLMHKVLSQGIIPALIVNPKRVFELESRSRSLVGEKPLKLTPMTMLKQAEYCATAARALDSILKMAPTMNDLQERLFVYYLQRTHCLGAYARVHYYLLLAQDCVLTGNAEQVTHNIAMGINALNDGLMDMSRILNITSKMRGYDPHYSRRALDGIFPAIPGADANFSNMRESLESLKRRMND